MTTAQERCPVHIAGLGSSGSHIGYHLAKRGDDSRWEFHGWDGDKVDDGNVRTQTYVSRHIGHLKVDMLAEQMAEWGGINLIRHTEYIDGPRPLAGIVFNAVDKMSNRRILWDHSIRGNPAVLLMIEMRLETSSGLIHVVNPNNPTHVRKWERHWYADEEASTAGLACSVATARYPIADLIANLCVTQFLKYAERSDSAEDDFDNQILVSLNPLTIDTRRW